MLRKYFSKRKKKQKHQHTLKPVFYVILIGYSITFQAELVCVNTNM